MEKWVSSARPSDIPGATHVNTPLHRPNIYTSLSSAESPWHAAVRAAFAVVQDLASSRQEEIYGEFFAVWKLWEDAIQRNGGERKELFERIAAAEAQLEALIVRISCQRALTQDEIHIAGAFRQAYQTLRKCMKHGQSLSADHGWNASNATPYAAFKGLAASVAVLLRPEQISVWKTPSAPTQNALMAAQSLRALTSNAYEPWVLPTGQEVVVWEAVARNHGLLDIHEDWPPPIGDGSPYYHENAVHRIS